MDLFVQQLINGLMFGSTYSLLAIGYTLIFGVLGILHIAHGEVFMAGALLGLQMVLLMHVNIYVALLGSMAGAALLGVIVELVSIRTLQREGKPLPLLAPLISTLGISLILQDLAVKYYGGRQMKFPTALEIYQLGPIRVTSVQITIVTISLAMMICLHLFIKKSVLGKTMRAVSENARMASLLGVNVNLVTAATFTVASALAGVAGMLVGLAYSAISPFMGVQIGLKGFAIIVIGGMGNITGAMVGGLILGMAEILSVAYLASSYRDAFAFGLMVIILLFKPTGIFGAKYTGGR